MDRSNYDDLIARAPTPEAAAKVRMFLDYHPSALGIDVPDPYYGGPDGFRDVVALVRAAADGLVRQLTTG